MASNRHLGRIIVLQSLYELAFRQEAGESDVEIKDIVERNASRYKAHLDDREFVERLTDGVLDKSEELDKLLQPLAPEWPLDQIARIDHIVLRIGAYELVHHKDVPPKVVINEAVELAKGFGGESSSRFVNGVLGTFLRQQDPDAESKEDKKPKKAKKDAS